MARKLQSDDRAVAVGRADGRRGSNSLFNGSQTNTQLAVQIGRGLQSRTKAALEEPLSDDLAALVRRLEERGADRPESDSW